VTQYAHPTRRELPGRKRCKVRHSKATPARCKHPRGHEGECWFGWWRSRGLVTNLDVSPPLPASALSGEPRTGAPENFDD
jgi:hypothetical protein